MPSSLGNCEIRRRREILDLLGTLPSTIVATDDELLHFIERHRLMGKAIGYVDEHLLASVTLTDGAQLWTRDSRLRAMAVQLGISARSWIGVICWRCRQGLPQTL